MESVRSAFHAQLATVMDSLLAAAVCEIAKIFESSLCDQQSELAQKTEEISVLRCELEKRERRLKGPGSEEGHISPGGREGKTRQQTGTGPNIGKSEPTDSDSEEVLSMLKQEVLGQDGASVKHEHSGSVSVTIQATDENLTTGDNRQNDGPSTQTKTKISNWNQSSHSADPRSLQDQASAPFVSISQSGRCSPRTDANLHQPGEWLPGLDATRGNVPGLENLQADGTDCSAPASGSAGVDPSCLPPGYGADKTSEEGDDRSFSFLNQEPENQGTEPSQDMGPRGARPGHPQASTGDAAWPTRADRAVRSPNHHTRRVTSFGNRDPLRPQLTSPSLAVRQLNTLLPAPALGGGNTRPYSCPYCSKCFTYPSHQRRHLLRHTGVRLHPCQFCDKSFLTPSELTVHTRTHTGERPFGCAQCGKRFARSGNLRAHQRDVHMGKRPFVCAECGKRFAHRGNLRVHNHRVHQGDPYYMDDQPEPEIGPNAI